MEAILLYALLKSALYALVALGLTLLFGVGGVLNLAHGALLMVAGYLVYILATLVGLPLWLAMGLAVLGSACLAVALYLGVVRPAQDSMVLTLILTFALALIVQQVLALSFGIGGLSTPDPVPGITRVGAVRVPNVQLAAFAVSWIAIVSFWILTDRTRFGLAIRALAMNAKGAALVGINEQRVHVAVWAISGALAGVAGVFFSYPGGIDPRMWVTPLVVAVAIVILGGLGSLGGSLLAAHLIGFVETFTFYAPQIGIPLGAAWLGLPSLALTIIVLFLRPQGLFGRPSP